LNISFQNIVPLPLLDRDLSHSEVWNKTIKIEPGDKIQVSAPSGTGKSTFSHILYGLRKDFKGALLFDTENTHSFSWQSWTALRKNKISIVFQDLRLFTNLNVFENLELKAALTGLYSSDEIKEMASALHIADKLYQKVASLSIGERQRVALIRALLQPFQYLILDEPFSHLDRDNSETAVGLIKQSCKKNNAGLIACQLHTDEWFDYDYNLKL